MPSLGRHLLVNTHLDEQPLIISVSIFFFYIVLSLIYTLPAQLSERKKIGVDLVPGNDGEGWISPPFLKLISSMLL